MTAKRSEEIATLAQAAGGCKAHEGGICPTKTVDSPDFGQLEPMVDPTEAEPEATGVKEKPEVALADTGYWHQEQTENVVGRGIQVLIPPDAPTRKRTRPGWDGGLFAFMRRVLATEQGTALYRKREAMIEPVLADTRFNRRLDRFLGRGRAACRSEWRLINARNRGSAVSAETS